MFNFLKRTVWIASVIVGLFFTGCAEEPKKPLRVGTNLWPGYETLYLARDLGFFEGSPIRLVELSSATDVIHAFRNGLLEVAALTLDETLTLLQTETDLRIFLIMDISSGADALLARASTVSKLSDLKDSRIAVENSAVGATMLIRALERANLSVDEIEIVPATVDRHVELYDAGKVDAVVTFDPVRTQLISKGAKVLFDSREIPGQIVDVLVTRKSLLEGRTEVLQQLVNGQFKSLEFLRNHPKETAKKLAPRLAITPDELTNSFKGMVLPGLTANQALIKGSSPLLRQTARELISMMIERGLLFKEPRTEALVSDRFLQ